MQSEPSKGAFDDPATGKNGKASLVVRTQDECKAKATMVGDPVEQARSSVTAIDPNFAQFLADAGQAAKEELCAFAVLEAGFRHHHRKEQTQGINEQVTLATCNILSFVVAPLAWHCCALDTLTVQTTRRGVFMAPRLLSHFRPQRVMNALPGAIIAPAPKVMVDALPVWIFLGQHPPLDATYHDVQDGVDDHAHIQAAWSSTRFGRWDQWLDNIPLAVAQVGWIDLCVHTHTLSHPLFDSRYFSDSFLDLLHVGSRGTLGALLDAELDAITFGEAAETRGHDSRLVYKDILAATFRRDETKALLIVEPLDGSFDAVTHCWKTPFPCIYY